MNNSVEELQKSGECLPTLKKREKNPKRNCKPTCEPNSVIMFTWAPSPLRACEEPVFSCYR